MPVGECLRKHTHRQYFGALAWLQEQWNHPSRSDQYLMQIAYEQRLANQQLRFPSSLQLKEFRLQFGEQDKSVQQTPEEAAKWAMMRWIPAVGGKVERKQG